MLRRIRFDLLFFKCCHHPAGRRGRLVFCALRGVAYESIHLLVVSGRCPWFTCVSVCSSSLADMSDSSSYVDPTPCLLIHLCRRADSLCCHSLRTFDPGRDRLIRCLVSTVIRHPLRGLRAHSCMAPVDGASEDRGSG
jgi:hypothetical protein